MSSEASRRLSAVKLALRAQQARQQGEAARAVLGEPLAIVGMGCRFPGGASDPQRYWQMLLDGTDAIREVPADRWDWRAFQHADPAAPGKITSRWGGFLDEVYGFDAEFFGISPREAQHMDPQQRLFMEVAWEAIEDAGLTREQLSGSRTGVFVASYHSDYAGLIYGARCTIGAHTVTGASHSVLANRLSYWLDLRGPSLSIDTACSSSLVALHLASRSLREGECDTAIVAGVSLMLTPELSIALSKWGFLAEDGRCKTFDARANGFVRGEGCGAVVLRRLGDVLAEGRPPLALVRGTAVNQDGRTNVLTAPSGLAQQAVVRAALADASLAPQDLSYIEAHGTGTALGDPIELEALTEVIGPRAALRRVAIGSAKTNIGHLEAAAGIAGVIKVAMALRSRRFAPHLHFHTPNPHFDIARSPLRVVTTVEPWPANDGPRCAGVSSFGFGGTNAHVILEEAPGLPEKPAPSPTGPFALPLSAASGGALRALAARHAERLAAADAPAAADMCFSAATERDTFAHRLVAVAADAEGLRQALCAAVDGQPSPALRQGVVGSGAAAGAVFVFSGQGPQWWAMGRELLTHEPVFANAVAEVDEAMRAHAPWRLLDELQAAESRSRLHETELAQPALFALQTGLQRLWSAWGVAPVGVVGHSAGEIAAACCAGVLDLPTAARLAVVRGRIMQAATGRGRMAAVEVDEARALSWLGSDPALSVAAVNGPRSVVISGDTAALEILLARLAGEGIGHRMLAVNYAFHSAQMEPLRRELERVLQGLRPQPGHMALYSTVSGARIDPRTMDAAYWGRNLRSSVRFAPAVAAAGEDGYRLFLELGPHPVLAMNIEATLEAHAGVQVFACLRRGHPERETLLQAAAGLHVAGAAVDWSSVLPAGRRVVLPHYPWQHSRYRVRLESEAALTACVAPAGAGGHPLLGRAVQSPAFKGTLYEQRLARTSPSWLADHRVAGACVMPAAGFVEMALAAAAQADPAREAWQVEDVVFEQPLALADEPRQVQFAPDGARTGGFRIFSRAEDGPGEWSCHAGGRIVAAVALVEPAADLPALLVRCPQAVAPDALYAEWATRGLAFGPAFRGLAELHLGRVEALARLHRPAALGEPSADLPLHPALLDAGLQALNTLLADEAGSPTETWVPFSLDRAFRAAGADEPAWSHVRLVPAAMPDLRQADITIYDAQSRAVAALRGLRLRRVAATAWTTQAEGASLLVEQWRSAPLAGAGSLRAGRWLVCAAEDHALVPIVQRHLRELGATVEHIDPLAPPAALNAWLADDASPVAGILYIAAPASPQARLLAGTAMTRLADGLGRLLALLQALVRSGSPATPLWMVARGARAARVGDVVDAAQAAAWGLWRSALAEYPDLEATALDLDPGPADGWLQPLFDELAASAVPHAEIAWRGNLRLVAQVQPVGPAAVAPVGSWRLEASEAGSLDALSMRAAARRAPGEGEVEIQVLAAGLNFRDVLNALGMYPGPAGPLGGECAGRVVRVGPGVSGLAPGDEVMAFARGSLASHVCAPACYVAPRPARLTWAEAAATPIAFLTAMYAFERLAGLQRGERVLIHSAAGGVGMAAVQLALALGAEVFATAGSAAKREALAALGVANVFDSRSLVFAEQVMAATGGRGVQVVLNALAGDFIAASLSALAPCGRFLEMGKRDIWTHERMRAARPDVAYHPFDLGDAADADAALVPALYARLAERLSEGSLQALPVMAFPVGHAAQAFRTMSQARHMGKIVLTMPRPPMLPINDAASVLVTGGLGALGLRVAQWLASQGARHLVLLGRRPPDAQALAALAPLQARGVRCRIVQGDVTDAATVQELAAQARAEGHPLRGAVHAAGLLDDGVLIEQDVARISRVLAPKLLGALHLDGLPDLDFLVLFSAGAAWLGSPGQAGYCAANLALDALAESRHARGLPATSIAWGAWAEAGMAAELSARDTARWRERGVLAMPTSVALALLQAAMQGDAPAVAALGLDAQRLAAPGLRWAALRKSADVGRPSPVGAAAELTGGGLRQRLETAAPSERSHRLLAHLTERCSHTLGLESGTPIDPQRPLKELGLDSLMAVELRNALATDLGRPLPATLLFDFPTLDALGAYLSVKVLGWAPAAPSAPAPAPAAAAELAAVAALSDEEAEAQLLAELQAPGDRLKS